MLGKSEQRYISRLQGGSFFNQYDIILDFVEDKLEYMEDLGLNINNMRYISQENCYDGIERPQCAGDDTSDNDDALISFENAFENFFQYLFFTFVDFLFFIIQY